MRKSIPVILAAICLTITYSCSRNSKPQKESSVKEELVKKEEIKEDKNFRFYVSEEKDGKLTYVSWVLIRQIQEDRKQLTFGIGVVRPGQVGEFSPENAHFLTVSTTYNLIPIDENGEIVFLDFVNNSCGVKDPPFMLGGLPAKMAMIVKEMPNSLALTIKGELSVFDRSNDFYRYNEIALSPPCPKSQ